MDAKAVRAGAFGVVCLAAGLAQAEGADREARVDAAGVLRWAGGTNEVALLGVNYYAPFSVDYAELARLGLDHRQAIRDDVAHLRRLGLGNIRLHCFDREFSDAEGNLLNNEHVALLDYLIAECASNGLYTVLTPIAWWGGSYAPGTTHGFSDRYAMFAMTTDRQAWEPQARFLKQFAEHVNRCTGRRYADDPAVLAFECINEPLYPKETPDGVVTAYIDALADALRAGGTAKPIFYNSWQGRNAAAGAARIDGVTGSVYPTGLASGRALKGPQLLRARGSSLQPTEAIAHKARMIYEFDAADVPGSHMYPSMAKFFRSEGIQVASQFQYDPLALAAVNHNWMTHHLNLVYTPGKALSLAIAAEVFRRVPRGVPFGALPEAAVFPPFRCSGEADLSELVTDDVYLNSNATATPPPKPEALRRVWGCGASPLVSYSGSGAYFLDRAAPGVWRFQLYPDIFTVADPYSGTAEPKVHVIPGTHPLTLRLPDLGARFTVRPFQGAAAGGSVAKAEKGTVTVAPGDYLLMRRGGLPREAELKAAGAAAPRYVAPAPVSVGAPLVRAAAPRQCLAGAPLTLRAEAAFATGVTARLTGPDGAVSEWPLAAAAGTAYAVEIPANALAAGEWGVAFAAAGRSGRTPHPEARTLDAVWRATAEPPTPLIRIPDRPDALQAVRHGVQAADVSLTEGRAAGTKAARLAVEGLGEGSTAAGFTLPFTAPGPLSVDASEGVRIVARGGAAGATVEVGFRQKRGGGLGVNLRVGPGWSETLVPLADMLPLWGLRSRGDFSWREVGEVSVLTGAWLQKEGREMRRTIDIASVEWVRLEPVFPLTVVDGVKAPWSLFDADAWLRVPVWHRPLKRWRTTDDQGRPALHLGVSGFDGELDSIGLRTACEAPPAWAADQAVVRVRARATEPHTTSFELALIEADGVPWGTVVPVTGEWRTLRIPVRDLRLFTQWGREFAASAGPSLRIARVAHVNVCFGRWLFKQAAAEPHALEISEIAIERAPQ